MRHWHRWAAIPAGAFLFLVALSGVLLHLDMIRLGQHPPGHDAPRAETVHPLPSDPELAAMVGRIAAAARQQSGVKVKVIQITLAGPRITLSAGSGGPPGSPQIKLDGVSGAPIIDPPQPADFHYILQDLHAGYFFGWTGRVISILTGLALIILSVTGLKLWWDMRRRGKKGLYWK